MLPVLGNLKELKVGLVEASTQSPLCKSTTVQYFLTSVPYSSPLKFRICCSLSLCAKLTSQPGFSGAAVMLQPHPRAGCRAESALRAVAPLADSEHVGLLGPTYRM